MKCAAPSAFPSLFLLTLLTAALAGPVSAQDDESAGEDGDEPTPPTVVRAPVRVGAAPT